MNVNAINKVKEPKTKSDGKKDIYIIGQGTYGCMYIPEISCDSKEPTLNKYVSKIQQDNFASRREIKIGKDISKIRGYNARFAPIIKTCPVNVATINGKELASCKMYMQAKAAHTTDNLITCKIRYVGKNTLGKELDSVLLKKRPSKNVLNRYCKQIAETHMYLLKSLSILNENGVLHLDMKENNVMYDETNHVPIIIDYGLSYNVSDLDIDEYAKNAANPFGVNVPWYSPWCIEVVILSYIAKQIQTKADSAYKVDVTRLDSKIEDFAVFSQMIENYMDKNLILQHKIFSANEVKDYKTGLIELVKGFKGKTWREVWKMVVASNKSWDNYGMSVLYLQELNISGLLDCMSPSVEQSDRNADVDDNVQTEQSFLKQYVDALKKVILSSPANRPIANEMHQILDNIFRKTSRKLYNDVITKFEARLKGEDVKETLMMNRLESTRTAMLQDNRLRVTRGVLAR
jgi:serine/threonine protein kinase